jgi:hypothetical protein
MKDQSCDVCYQAAMDAATAELEGLFEEARRLRNRMEQIDELINALKKLVEPSESNSAHQQLDSELSAALA